MWGPFTVYHCPLFVSFSFLSPCPRDTTVVLSTHPTFFLLRGVSRQEIFVLITVPWPVIFPWLINIASIHSMKCNQAASSLQSLPGLYSLSHLPNKDACSVSKIHDTLHPRRRAHTQPARSPPAPFVAAFWNVSWPYLEGRNDILQLSGQKNPSPTGMRTDAEDPQRDYRRRPKGRNTEFTYAGGSHSTV